MTVRVAGTFGAEGDVVVTKVQSVMGNVGYRHQLDRARRFLDWIHRGYEGIEDLNDVEFQDMLWSFFQHCWHIKDWLHHDPLASTTQKETAIAMAHSSGVLMICRDLCNGTKHLNLSRPSSGIGASHQYVDMDIDTGVGRYEVDCIIDDGYGKQLSGKKLARDCIVEWERILTLQGLATGRLS